MNDFLIINKLSKIYHDKKSEVLALKDITTNIKEGEFIAIVGPSGCGKSTLLSILAGIDKSSTGKFFYKKQNATIGYMLQQDALFPWLSIKNNVFIGLDILKIKDQTYRQDAIILLNTYGLKEYKDKYPNQLSGGMRQRVALIRTLAIKPDILLLDEPFCALDYQTRLQVADDVYKIIKDSKKTTILVTHDLAEAISMADKIIVLSKRPAVIKNIYEIKYENRSIPSKNRQAKEFNSYYNTLWKDLDNNDIGT